MYALKVQLKSVLVVDDDDHFLAACERGLTDFFSIQTAATLESAEQFLRSAIFDAVVLDYYMGNSTIDNLLSTTEGWQSRPAIVVVSGKADKDLVIRMLNRQVTAFLEKPISLKDLRERLSSAVRTSVSPMTPVLEIPHLRIEFHVQYRLVKIDGVSIQLTPIESTLLHHFIEAQGKVVERQDLIRKIWGGMSVSRNVLDTHIGNLKKKVPVLGLRLKSIYGSGYVFQSKD